MRPYGIENKYLSEWCYVELGRYLPETNSVTRIKRSDGQVLFPYSDVEVFRKKYDNIGIYTSIWFYNSADIESSTRFGPLYFDLDSDSLESSLGDVRVLYSELENYIPSNAISIFFTGKKGFHIECDPVCIGINPSNNLKNIYRYIASSLKSQLNIQSIDLQVYDNRRMWRLEGSKHQSTGLYKNKLPAELLESSIDDIKNFCKNQIYDTITETSFSGKANEWYRNLSYNMEIDKERSKDFIGYFNKYGTKAFKKIEETNKEFTPKNLLENCHSIKDLWQEAIDKKHLDHEARLFLCSILTYTPESIEMLHGILSNCSDYNFEKTDSHIQDWIRRRQLGIGGRPFTCSRANASGVGCMDCALESKPKWVKVGDSYIETEEKLDPSPVRFAYQTKKINKEVN
jgi:hypothetical protein